MPHNLVVRVAEQEDLGAGYFRIRLDAPEIAAESRAGQFVMLGLPDIDVMLVRRPFSVARAHPDPRTGAARAIDILYKVFGRRTLAFSHLRAGAEMSVLGPLGRGFWSPEDDEAELILVAGGIGIAPFPMLLQQLGGRGAGPSLYFGGRTRADLILLDWLQQHCARVVATTEDGSVGERGLVTAPLERTLDRGADRPQVVMACGPPPMLRAVAKICRERGVPCQISVEETMACGFGVCLGCVVERCHPESEYDRFARVCTEGPVFDAREIEL